MFHKILIANRGEIALRIIRACRELGIETVAVHSTADSDALHVRLADEAVCIGPPESAKSYLHVPAIISAAEISGAQAIHPGYGFLSENAAFARTCGECGLAFIGPRPEDIDQWGDKISARDLADKLGLPVLRGSSVLRSVDDAVTAAESLKFPLMLKATAGGGGRGMKVLKDLESLRRVFTQTQEEALAGFGNGDLYLERYIEEPRHIEFQIVADGRGRVSVLGERECSIQRRHQKILEEAPSVALDETLREDLSRTIEKALIQTGYVSAGTLEFLMDDTGKLSFLEMNTRIQVEHPITEAVTSVDLVTEQIRIAAGHAISFPKKTLTPRGHAIECRINAEDPDTFAPWPGKITEYHPPGGTGIRVDSGVYGGFTVPPHYDSLILKVIAHGADRPQAIARMQRALGETIVGGIRTNIPLHQRILAHPDFIEGKTSTHFLSKLGS